MTATDPNTTEIIARRDRDRTIWIVLGLVAVVAIVALVYVFTQNNASRQQAALDQAVTQQQTVDIANQAGVAANSAALAANQAANAAGDAATHAANTAAMSARDASASVSETAPPPPANTAAPAPADQNQ